MEVGIPIGFSLLELPDDPEAFIVVCKDDKRAVRFLPHPDEPDDEDRGVWLCYARDEWMTGLEFSEKYYVATFPEAEAWLRGHNSFIMVEPRVGPAHGAAGACLPDDMRGRDSTK